MNKYTTILDIANHVGLSHMTVSRVLSGKSEVSEKTRRRVLIAAEELNYSPNGLANGFRSGRTQSAGIVWQFVDPWAGDTAVGLWVMQALQKNRLAIYPSQFHEDVPAMSQVLDELLRRRVDAIVIGGTPEVLSHDDIRRRLSRVPAVTTVSYRQVEGLECDQIVYDRNEAIRQVVRHLAAIGRRRPSFVTSLEVSANTDKVRVFREACERCGIPWREDALLLMDLPRPTVNQPFLADTDRYREAMEVTWPAGRRIDIDALFSFNDLGAMACCNFLHKRGVRVPEDVAVIGFNDDPAASLWQPPLASGDRCRAELAEKAKDMVLSRLEEPSLPPRIERIEMKFIWRASAGGSGEGKV